MSSIFSTQTDMTSKVPFGLTIHNSTEKRQLRNIDRSMKSITNLLKKTHSKNTKHKKKNKIIPRSNRKSKVLIVLDDQKSKSKLKVSQPEVKKAAFFDAEAFLKSNQELTVTRTSELDQTKYIFKQCKNKITEVELNSSKVIKTYNQQRKTSIHEHSIRKEKEFYPNTLKRKLQPNHDWLKPKTESKTLCRLEGVIKRKLYVPRQDSRALKSCVSKKNLQPNYSELGVKEMVRVVEDKGLSEEDFMEILTCPSPVWWEDQNDSSNEFIEDAIPGEILDEVDEKLIVKIMPNGVIKENKPVDSLKGIKITTSDDKFMMKRSKLESVLGNIMKNVKPCNTSDTRATVEVKAMNIKEDIPKIVEMETKNVVIDSVEIIDKLSEIVDTDTISDGINNPNTDNDNKIEPEIKEVKEISDEILKTKEKSISISTDDDVSLVGSLCDEDILKDLEGMEIPVQKHEEPDISSSADDSELKEVYIICDKEDTKDEMKDQNRTERSFLNPHSLPSVENKPQNHRSLLKKLKEVKEATDLDTGLKNLDSTSNGNVPFVTEPENYRNEDKNIIGTIKDNLNAKNHLDQNKTDIQIGKINTFYKKCKNSRRHKLVSKEGIKNSKSFLKSNPNTNQGTDAACRSCNAKDNKSLNVTNNPSEKVKYCYHCSAIFDTDKCNYCSNSSKSGNIVPQCCSVRDVKSRD